MDTKGALRYGERLLPCLIDQLARDEPQSPWISVPVSTDLADGFKDITYFTLANAVNRAAHWIHSQCGRSIDFETLPYIGPNDARYFILFAAAVKTGYKVSPVTIRPRNVQRTEYSYYVFRSSSLPLEIASAAT